MHRVSQPKPSVLARSRTASVRALEAFSGPSQDGSKTAPTSMANARRVFAWPQHARRGRS